MNDYIWNGEMDCSWDELLEKIKKESQKFIKEMSKLVVISPIEEVRNLISKESLERLCLLVEQLENTITEGTFNQIMNLDNVQNVAILMSWIILGSLTETILQMFLAFYMDDFKKSQWQQWIDFPATDVKNKVNSTISKLVEDGIIKSNQGKSLKNAIKNTIKKHCVERPVQKIMLDELIQYYASQELLDQEEIKYLKCIQSNRNGIHSFENKPIGNLDELKYAIRFWCYLLEWILYRLPDIPSYE